MTAISPAQVQTLQPIRARRTASAASLAPIGAAVAQASLGTSAATQQAAAGAQAATLGMRGGISVGFRASGWVLPIGGALLGACLFGLPGAVVGGLVGYLIARR